MEPTRREALRELLRRVDEVRGMSERGEAHTALEPGDTDALIHTLSELVEELERSHRRLIETNVQLVSLREVASSMVTALDTGETTRTVTRYLSRAFGFEDVFLLLIDRERGVLEGTWTRRVPGHDREQSFGLELPMLGDHGAATRALWMNRTTVQHDVRLHPPAVLPDGHPLADVLDGLGPVACVPLQRSHALLPPNETHELCGARCILGDSALLAPPPGPAAERWAMEREERQAHCLQCDFLPSLGVLGVAREPGHRPHQSGDVELLESIALSVAPMVENARLYQDLRRSERFRENILHSMASALVAVNLKGEVLTFNHTAEELLGFKEAEVLGRPFGTLFGSEGEGVLMAALEHGRTVRREETLLRRQDGRPIPVSLTTSLLRQERRGVSGAIATFVDLTPFKRAEEHARRLDRLAALGRFTSSVAHEIRNPLAGIAAGVQYLVKSLTLEGQQAESLTFIQSEIKRLDRILQDLFDITHPRALSLRAAEVEGTVRRAAQCLEALQHERGVRLSVEVAPRTPAVPHDEDQMEQVFINLFKNAIEASPSGSQVRVEIGPAAAAGDPRTRLAAPAGGALVRVSDQGPGIAPEHLKSIFEPFFTTKAGGSGLGLFVSHDIVKRHGGGITVQSGTAGGTVFSVELPLEHTGGTP
jgi:PAS domain S-box-containing protein